MSEQPDKSIAEAIARESSASAEGLEGRADRWGYCCADCLITFTGPYRDAKCPKCGEMYGLGHPVMRTDGFGFAHWRDYNRDLQLVEWITEQG